MIPLRFMLAAAVACGLAFSGHASSDGAPAFTTPALPDPLLATQRGGIRLPNGIDLALTVQTQTAVNGAVVLQTIYALDKGPASLTIYAPSPGSEVPARPAASPVVAAAAMTPIVAYDPRTGLSVTQGYSGMPVTVASGAPAGRPAVAEGLMVVDPASGPQTTAGSISTKSDGLLKTVTLAGSDFTVAHLAGSAFGTAVANAGSDRAIDTITSISLDLRNAGPDVLGSAFLRVEGVALGALGSRM